MQARHQTRDKESYDRLERLSQVHLRQTQIISRILQSRVKSR